MCHVKFSEFQNLKFKLSNQEKDLKLNSEDYDSILNAQKEINELKKNSISDINKISENIASNLIESISGDKLNESSVKATVDEVSKRNVGKYL